MSYFVYFLKSEKNGDLYIGSTENVDERVGKHNGGKVKSTKGYRPWVLLGYEQCGTRSEAFRKEMFYKSGQQRELLKERYGLL
jgi:putative endonuclease